MADWRCAICDKDHGEPPRDVGFALPDEVFALSEEERRARAATTPDHCTLDERRRFVRGVLDLQTPDTAAADGDDRVSIGLWVEVHERDFEAIVGFAGQEHDRERDLYQGIVANAIHGVPGALALEVIVRPTS